MKSSGITIIITLCAGFAAVAQEIPTATPAEPVISSFSLTVAVMQTALDRHGFGVGFIDGFDGPRTQAALSDFSESKGISPEMAKQGLLIDTTNGFTNYTITSNDLNQIGEAPNAWLARAKAESLAYTSLLEELCEKFHVAPALLCRLNPQVAGWHDVPAGTVIRVPDVNLKQEIPQAAWIEINCRRFRLRIMDEQDRPLASFPCSVAMDRNKIPIGELRITTFAPNPIYVFDPDNYPELSAGQAKGKLIIPAGPNNPVGNYWLSLNLPGYGIHGTYKPETIGRAESHGCFRLTNWDIVLLAKAVKVGTLIRVVDFR